MLEISGLLTERELLKELYDEAIGYSRQKEAVVNGVR